MLLVAKNRPGTLVIGPFPGRLANQLVGQREPMRFERLAGQLIERIRFTTAELCEPLPPFLAIGVLRQTSRSHQRIGQDKDIQLVRISVDLPFSGLLRLGGQLMLFAPGGQLREIGGIRRIEIGPLVGDVRRAQCV